MCYLNRIYCPLLQIIYSYFISFTCFFFLHRSFSFEGICHVETSQTLKLKHVWFIYIPFHSILEIFCLPIILGGNIRVINLAIILNMMFDKSCWMY